MSASWLRLLMVEGGETRMSFGDLLDVLYGWERLTWVVVLMQELSWLAGVH